MNVEREKLEAELGAALGALAIQFGRLEHSVSELVTAAFGRMDISSCEAINSVVSFRQKLDLVGALAPARIKDKKQLDDVQQCIRTLAKFEERRNSLLHSFWSYEPEAKVGAQSLFQKRTRAHRVRGLVPSSHIADVGAIQKLTAEIASFRKLFGEDGALYHAIELMYDASNGIKEA